MGGYPPSLRDKKSNKINSLDDMTEDIYKPLSALSSTQCMPSVSEAQGGTEGGVSGHHTLSPCRSALVGQDTGRPQAAQGEAGGAPPGRAAILAAMRAGSPHSSRTCAAYCGVSLPGPGRRPPPRAARPPASWERGHLGRLRAGSPHSWPPGADRHGAGERGTAE